MDITCGIVGDEFRILHGLSGRIIYIELNSFRVEELVDKNPDHYRELIPIDKAFYSSLNEELFNSLYALIECNDGSLEFNRNISFFKKKILETIQESEPINGLEKFLDKNYSNARAA